MQWRIQDCSMALTGTAPRTRRQRRVGVGNKGVGLPQPDRQPGDLPSRVWDTS